MNTEEEIRRIMAARNRIREKLMELGLSESMDRMDGLADALEQMRNNGSVSVQVKEGDTYTIPKGYHSGGGTVSGVAGGGSYKLQKKSILPDKFAHSVTPDKGFYGLSDVTVRAIPPEYVETGDATALAGELLTGKTAYAKGQKVTGTMADNGDVSAVLDCKNTEYKVPAGHHNGNGVIKVVPEMRTATPTKSVQTVQASPGKVMSHVTVKAIPPEYVETGDATALAGELLTGKTAYAKGQKVTGTMADNGDVSASMDGLTVQSCVIPAGHTSGGTIRLTQDIENALGQI